MANDFYGTPNGLLTQAAGHASSLVADAGGAWGEAFKQLGQWAETEKLQNQQIAASREAQQMQIKAQMEQHKLTLSAEKDRALEAGKIHLATTQLADGINRGEYDLDTGLRYLDAYMKGEKVDDLRKVISGAVSAATLKNQIIPGFGKYEDATTRMEGAITEAQDAITRGDMTTLQARIHEIDGFVNGKESRQALSVGARSRDPVVQSNAMKLLSGQWRMPLAQALTQGYGKTEGGLLGAGWSPELSKLGAVVGNEPEKANSDQKERWRIAQGQSIIRDKDGKIVGTNVAAASAYMVKFDQLYSQMAPGVLGDQYQDPNKRMEFMGKVEPLVGAITAAASAGSVSPESLTSTIKDAVNKLAPSGTPADRASAFDLMQQATLAAVQVDAVHAAGFLSGLDYTKTNRTELIRNIPVALPKYSEGMAKLETLQSAEGIARIRSETGTGLFGTKAPWDTGARKSAIDPKRAAGEIAMNSLSGNNELSPTVSGQLLQAEKIQVRLAALQREEQGDPVLPGGQSPTREASILAGVAREAAARYLAARGDPMKQAAILAASSKVLIARGAPISEQSAQAAIKWKIDLLDDKGTAKKGLTGLVKEPAKLVEQLKGDLQAAVRGGEDTRQIERAVFVAERVRDLLAGYDEKPAWTDNQRKNFRSSYKADASSPEFKKEAETQRGVVDAHAKEAMDNLKERGILDSSGKVQFRTGTRSWDPRGERALQEAITGGFGHMRIDGPALNALSAALQGTSAQDAEAMIRETLASKYDAVNVYRGFGGEVVYAAGARIVPLVANRLKAIADPALPVETYDSENRNVQEAKRVVMANRASFNVAAAQESPVGADWLLLSRSTAADQSPQAQLRANTREILQLSRSGRGTPEQLKLLHEANTALEREVAAQNTYFSIQERAQAVRTQTASREKIAGMAVAAGKPVADVTTPGETNVENQKDTNPGEGR